MKISYVPYLLKDNFFKVEKRLFKIKSKNKYAHRIVLNIEDGNDCLLNALKSGKPLLVTRYGANELNVTIDSIIKDTISSRNMFRLCNNAGFFPQNEKYGDKFAKIMVESSRFVDFAALYYASGEEYLLDTYAPNAILVNNRAIEPWYSTSNPWSAELKGKKVLVIHPFDNTIREQYKKRELIFPNSDILPEFSLFTLKAVQTIAGQKDKRFNDWFEALDYMFEETKKIEYDVAILGCGAYGLPLAAKIKASGKQAIHLGGATQLLFGIKGTRWDEHPIISKFYNSNWVRPSADDIPQNAYQVEKGCYW